MVWISCSFAAVCAFRLYGWSALVSSPDFLGDDCGCICWLSTGSCCWCCWLTDRCCCSFPLPERSAPCGDGGSPVRSASDGCGVPSPQRGGPLIRRGDGDSLSQPGDHRRGCDRLCWGAVARTEAAFPRTIAIDSRCLSHAVSRRSPVRAEIRRPRSWTKAAAAGPYTPLVSSATGSKM